MDKFDSCLQEARKDAEREERCNKACHAEHKRMTENAIKAARKRRLNNAANGVFIALIVFYFGVILLNGVMRNEVERREAEEAETSNYTEEIEAPCVEHESPFKRMTRLDDVTVTHYAVCMECCGKTDGITRSGRKAIPYYSVAVDPDVIPLGSTVYVDYNDGVVHECRADDTGGAIKGNHIDMCVSSYDEAVQLGITEATIY